MKSLLANALISLLALNAFASDKFSSHEVSFQSSRDGLSLNGTYLSVSQSKGTVLLLVGSGKTDRDESASPAETYSGKSEKAFKQISEALASAGYSSFRYDKRGVKMGVAKVNKKIWKKADRDHLISDATDAAIFLQTSYGVNTQDLVILGHSEGTILGVEVAIALKKQLKGLVLLGVVARSMKDLLYYQIVESPHPSTSGKYSDALKEYEAALDLLSNSKDEWAPDGKPMAWYRQYLKAPANEERIPLVKAPIAVFQGEVDSATPVEEVNRLRRLKLPNITFQTYPGLGHAFSPDKDGSPTYGPVDNKVLEDIVKAVEAF